MLEEEEEEETRGGGTYTVDPQYPREDHHYGVRAGSQAITHMLTHVVATALRGIPTGPVHLGVPRERRSRPGRFATGRALLEFLSRKRAVGGVKF